MSVLQDWRDYLANNKIKKENFNHMQELQLHTHIKTHAERTVSCQQYNLEPGKVLHLQGIFHDDELQGIINSINTLKFFPVGTSGNALDYEIGDKISSYRASTYDEDFANFLFWQIGGFITQYRKETGNHINHGDHRWFPVFSNPYVRFINYTQDGILVPHYDGHYTFNEQFQTLMTCLVYLTDNEHGQTVFLKDPQKDIPISQRNAPSYQYNNDDILLSIKPKKGDVLLFDQHLLHATSPLHGEHKSLILSDIIYSVADQ